MSCLNWDDGNEERDRRGHGQEEEEEGDRRGHRAGGGGEARTEGNLALSG